MLPSLNDYSGLGANQWPFGLRLFSLTNEAPDTHKLLREFGYFRDQYGQLAVVGVPTKENIITPC